MREFIKLMLLQQPRGRGDRGGTAFVPIDDISQVSLLNRNTKRKTASRRSLRNPIRCFDQAAAMSAFQLFSCAPIRL